MNSKVGRLAYQLQGGNENMKKKMIVSIVAALLITALVLLGYTPEPAWAKETYTWKFQAHMAPTSITTGKNLDRFIEMVYEATGGQVKITRYPNDSLVPTMEMLNATNTGTLDSFVAVGGYWQGTIPVAAVENGLPGGWRTYQEAEAILWDKGLEALARQEYAKHNIHLITDFPCLPGFLTYHMAKPISSLADIKGKKIRAFGPYLDLTRNLGASPVSMALSEVYLGIATGALDGAFLAVSYSGPNKYYEVAPYLLFPPVDFGGTHHWMVNADKWKELPVDLQNTIMTTAKKWARWHSRVYMAENAPTEKVLTKWGFKILQLGDDYANGLNKASQKYWEDTAAKDPVAARGVQIVRDYVKRIGR
jgi:TRAP-type C4-dicarboxylate transport system substrate-binding protein